MLVCAGSAARLVESILLLVGTIGAGRNVVWLSMLLEMGLMLWMLWMLWYIVESKVGSSYMLAAEFGGNDAY